MIVGKPKLRHIARPGTVDHFERPSYLCGGVAKRAGAYFTAEQARPDVHPLLRSRRVRPQPRLDVAGVPATRSATATTASPPSLAAIDRSGLADSTLVIVTADHGGHGKHHSGGHAESIAHIPWIARGPGVPADAFLEEAMTTVDTAATALAALGLPSSPGMKGVSRLTFAP